MKMTHFYLTLSLVALAALFSACGSNSESESVTQARERASFAAIALMACDSNDIMCLQDRLLNARSLRCEYLLKGDTAAADTFDVTFRNFVASHDRNLANRVFKINPAAK